MKRTLTLLTVGSVLLFSSVARAQDPLECVDPDIVKTLLSDFGGGPTRISRELPARFPAIALPKTMELIGGKNMFNYFTVAFKSGLPMEEARASVDSALADAQFNAYERPAMRLASGGFQTPETRSWQNSNSFCHRKYGHLTAAFEKAAGNATYVMLTGSAQRSPDSCDATRASLMLAGVADQPSKMPQLSLPTNATSTGYGGISSSGDEASTSIQMETSLSPAELVAFFGAQMTEQNWNEETHWSGQKVSGSVWISADEQNSGVLSVISLDDKQYKLTFQMTMLH